MRRSGIESGITSWPSLLSNYQSPITNYDSPLTKREAVPSDRSCPTDCMHEGRAQAHDALAADHLRGGAHRPGVLHEPGSTALCPGGGQADRREGSLRASQGYPHLRGRKSPGRQAARAGIRETAEDRKATEAGT